MQLPVNQSAVGGADRVQITLVFSASGLRESSIPYVETLLIGGMFTNCCCYSTAMEAMQRNFQVQDLSPCHVAVQCWG